MKDAELRNMVLGPIFIKTLWPAVFRRRGMERTRADYNRFKAANPRFTGACVRFIRDIDAKESPIKKILATHRDGTDSYGKRRWINELNMKELASEIGPFSSKPVTEAAVKKARARVAAQQQKEFPFPPQKRDKR